MARSQRPGNRRRRQAPVAQELPPPVEVDIVDLNHDGQGVCRHQGRTLFVSGALPGERVLARYRQRRGKFDVAIAQQLISPSEQRVKPGCRHFGRCGGCQLQHLDGGAQRHHKQQLLLDTLQRIGGVTPRHVLPVVADHPWQYRRRARLAVRWLKKAGCAELGFRESGSEQLVAISECPILAPPFDQLIQPLAELVASLDGRERVRQIELLAMDSGNAVNVHMLGSLSEQDRLRLQTFGWDRQLQLYRQSGGTDTLEALSEPAQSLSYRVASDDVSLQVTPGSFVQVNGAVNNKLVDQALQLLQLNGSERVLDLFCGLGNFTLPLACRADFVVGVEGSQTAIDLAGNNVTANRIDNVEFHVADLSQCQRHRPWGKARYDVVVLDPPRSGAREVLPLVTASGAGKLLYVSCHPGSLARDLGVLVNDFGYQLESVAAVDMFPQTAHLEALVLLKKA
ncbi:23S rRNA (uracil(1939)-C(5))-methyltransferase RlmD [Porticoccus sp. W117]|uniref:23S rRNA (uracil(1939)-C(5))-methyltransferase RlmD n=1 Tax=Porticoccus sp. W117 TaxID=3054777 RepID=UPI0025939516|nr:23S rRNA (uracil(1939)-C(5))-methyltransferase RlmD [Porticoccus sp. W117]MDM3871890.1 23S rRNA (uracil(1939)-C(5))-methyltransferase RlmD [Porticoccus sp. W117]